MAPSRTTSDRSTAAISAPGLLVGTEWLNDHMVDPRMRIVDLRESDSYAESHIPGAVSLDLNEIGHRRGPCDNIVLPPDAFGSVVARLGIGNEDTVVAYDEHWGLPSARFVWALHYYGHPSVAVLDGGWDRWEDDDLAVTNVVPEQRTTDFQARPAAPVYADRAWVEGAMTRPGVVILDTRSQAEFDQGHVPGAIAWDWFNAVPVGSWACSRDPEDLRSELGELGVRPSDEIVVYCRSGMRAAHSYLVLRNADFERVRLYDGSWQEWTGEGP
jgi:thiosulfate/3-mercaptopyruvate sulfurtransferase